MFGKGCLATCLEMNPYFEISGPVVLESVESVLSLNIQKQFSGAGETFQVTEIGSTYRIPHMTAGIFRGQIRNWPLLPQSFRGVELASAETSQAERSYHWYKSTQKFRQFCERAEVQNPAFPTGTADRMSIAQHFGVATPFLDWTRSIFTAVFFAVREVFANPEFENDLKVFMYHIIDERLLRSGLPDEPQLIDFAQSAFVEPFHIDRRIERQRGVFTYHPHPMQRPPKIQANCYVIEWSLIEQLLNLMKGFGFTEDYFFPDYAGIATAVNFHTSL